jgi:hypothetical protein
LQIKNCTIYALRDERNICKLFMVVNPVCYVGLTTDNSIGQLTFLTPYMTRKAGVTRLRCGHGVSERLREFPNKFGFGAIARP